MGKSGLNKFIYLLQASLYFFGRDAGVVERGGLENRCGLRATVGSNPTLSAERITFRASSPAATLGERMSKC